MTRLLPPLNTLPAFVKVAEHLSFSKAADALDVTHSAISQHVRSLENFLGRKLFNREGHKISLTSNGKAFYHIIENALNLIGDATATQKSLQAENILTVKAPPTLMAKWLIPKLADFHKKYSKIDLRFSTHESQVDNLQKHNIDFALVYGEAKLWLEFDKHKIANDHLVLVANPKFLPRHLSLKTLLDKSKVIYIDADLRRLDWQKWCKHAGVAEPKKSNRIIFQNTLQALHAAHAGVGLLVTHKFLVETELRSRELNVFSDVTLPLSEAYYLLYQKDKLLQAGYKIVYEWLIS